MKVLILINQAPNYGYTYTEVGNYLKSKGHEVVYALDSTLTFSDYEECFDQDDEIHIFSDYFKAHPDNIEINAKEFYDHNLWMMFYSDWERIELYELHKKKPANYFKSVIANLFNFYEKIFTEDTFDCMVYENVTNSFVYTAYLMGQKYNVGYFGVTATALPNRFSIEPHPIYESDVIMENYEKIKSGDLKVAQETADWVQKYYDDFMAIEPDYMKNERKLLKKSLLSKYLDSAKVKQIKKILKFFKKYGIKENYYIFQSPALTINLSYLRRNVKRKMRLNKIVKLYDVDEVSQLNENENYLVYPIHFHPEASTSILAPIYIDEYYNILNISLQLPYNYTLLVKEHPSAVGFTGVEFYEKIKKLPNVKLIHHNVRAKQMVRKSKGVITVTNTMGYESLIMGKKTFLLGRIFYETHPNCVCINSFNELYDKIVNEIDNHVPVDPVAYIQAYYLNTFKGTAVYEKEVDMDYVAEIGTQIIRRFES